ncbi:dormancy-associated protein-like 1 [Forsythia ovata]|uniref:Dormancy-associated protein-like 1 n=1 Tax=Forsythia ovata TaxID=205694 RepID=A0ABD1S2N6_9LAMI
MVLLDQLWDDVVAGPQPERGLKHLKKVFAKPLIIKDVGVEGSSNYQRSMSMPASPGTPATPITPTTPSPTAVRKDNVWRSVFHPGSNLATKSIGSDYFDKPQPNSPTVYDWLYSGETRSKHHR